MKPSTSVLLLCGVVALGAIAHCGGGSSGGQGPSTLPTQPATTTTTRPAGIVLPAGMVCDPTPPPLYRMEPKMWMQRGGGGWILDSKPRVMNVDNYCDRVGIGAGRFCDTRPEGNPQRQACDYLAVGQASDTGRWGPTWTLDGKACDPPGNAGGTNRCLNAPTEQFQVIAKGPGLYQACASPLARVDPEGSRCGEVQVP
ncbi:MAG: hypothetical protein ACM3PV_14060 [Betaproteobacteria bacterium]